MRDHPTFRQILDQAADANSRRLLERARLAGSIAKCTRNASSRRAAYDVKHRALEHGVATFAASFALSGVEEDGRLLRLRWPHEACLHLPVAGCGEGTTRWLQEERARISTEWGGMSKAA